MLQSKLTWIKISEIPIFPKAVTIELHPSSP